MRPNLGEFRQELKEDLARQRFNYEELSRRAERKCGSEPSEVDESKWRRWNSCMHRFRSRLKRTKHDIERLQLQARQFR